MVANITRASKMIRRIYAFLICISLLGWNVAPVQASYFCKKTQEAHRECCCKAATAKCAASTPKTCSCCDVEISSSSGDTSPAPLATAPALQRPDRIEGGFPGATGVSLIATVSPLRFGSPENGFRHRSPSSLYLVHRVLLC